VEQLNDAELASLLKAHDIKAFDLLYHRYFNAIYANVLKLTRETDVTKDIVQEVFIALWDNRKTIDTRKSIGGWLFTCSYHKSVNHLKKQLGVSRILSTLPEADIITQDTDFGKDQTEMRSKLLEEAIGQLSPQKRKVFELCKLQGKSYEQTATELSLSRHTVKEYLSGSMVIIKNHIRQHAEYYANRSDTLLLVWLCIGLVQYLF